MCAVWPAKRLPEKIFSCYLAVNLDTQFLGAWENPQVKRRFFKITQFSVYVVRGPPVQRLPGTDPSNSSAFKQFSVWPASITTLTTSGFKPFYSRIFLCGPPVTTSG